MRAVSVVCSAEPRSARKPSWVAGGAGAKVAAVDSAVACGSEKAGSVSVCMREVSSAATFSGPGRYAGHMVIAMSALVVACDLAQVGRGTRFGHSAFAHTGHGCSVVAEVFQRRVAHTLQLSLHVDLAKEASLLQVAVGDVALGVVNADQGILNVLGEGVTPIVACGRQHQRKSRPCQLWQRQLHPTRKAVGAPTRPSEWGESRGWQRGDRRRRGCCERRR